jgi:L-cysteine desulfidase
MYTAKEIILSQIKPALGCTEPAAIALNASYLKELDINEEFTLTINTNLLKNAMYVPIPNTEGRYGVKLAFALGILCGNKNYGLNVFKDVTPECLKKAIRMLDKIDVEIIDGNEIYIKSESKNSKVITKKFHDHIVFIKDGSKTYNFATPKTDINSTEEWLKQKSLDEVFELIEKERDFSFLKKSIDMNLHLSKI